MTMIKIPDIAIGIVGDHVHLEQDAGCGETVVVSLHRIHLEHIAQLMGLAQPDGAAQKAFARVYRQMTRLRDMAEDLADFLRSVPSYPPGKVSEDVQMADALLETVEEYLFEIDQEMPAAQTNAEAPSVSQRVSDQPAYEDEA